MGELRRGRRVYRGRSAQVSFIVEDWFDDHFRLCVLLRCTAPTRISLHATDVEGVVIGAQTMTMAKGVWRWVKAPLTFNASNRLSAVSFKADEGVQIGIAGL